MTPNVVPHNNPKKASFAEPLFAAIAPERIVEPAVESLSFFEIFYFQILFQMYRYIYYILDPIM